jgi:hypothetical protein
VLFTKYYYDHMKEQKGVKKEATKILFGDCERKSLLVKHWPKLKDNIKINLKKILWVGLNWSDDKGQWSALVITVTKVQGVSGGVRDN